MNFQDILQVVPALALLIGVVIALARMHTLSTQAEDHRRELTARIEKGADLLRDLSERFAVIEDRCNNILANCQGRRRKQ